MQIKSQAPHNRVYTTAKQVAEAHNRPEPAAATVTGAREPSLDIWRGIAVVSMIITHAIAFFHVGENQLINTLGLVGGTISFIMFLFVSGASTYLSYIRYNSASDAAKISRRRGKILSRTLTLLGWYYIVAFVASIPLYSIPPNLGWIENISRTVLFIDMPEFTEFIVPFLILGLSVIPLRRFYKFIVEKPLLAIIIGLLVYALGSVLFHAEVSGVLVNLKSVFVGEQEWHRFPVLQYFIVYLFGICWGRFLSRYSEMAVRLRTTLLATIATGVLAVLGVISLHYTQFDWLDALNRWPPSLVFILFGLFGGYITFLVLQLTRNLDLLGIGKTMVQYMGVNAFDYFIFHTILLFLYKYVTGDKHTDSVILLAIMFTLLLVFTTMLSILKVNVVHSLKADVGEDEGFRWLFSERLVITVIWIGIVLIAGMGIFQGRVSSTSVDPDKIAFRKRLLRENEWPFWWDNEYSYFRQIFIQADANGNPVQRNSWYSLSLDHATLAAQGQSSANGADVRIVYYNEEDGNFIELPIVFNGINTAGANIQFKLQKDIEPGLTEDKYFLYYGNANKTAYPDSKEAPLSVLSSNISLSNVYSHQISGSTNRKWLLKEGSVSLQLKTLLFKANLAEDLSPDSIVTYNIVGTDLRGMMDNMGGRSYQASIKINDLPVGKYQVQAVARQPENKLKLIESGYTTFFVTYPLYVTWTQDWEGWDVPDGWLTDLDAFANRYGVPMTHFFNPRIYVTNAVSKERAAKLTLWVSERAQKHNDEIGLHLHMWYDMVQAAGVTPRYTPYAGWLYGDGGGVAAYAYPADEMKKILQWSKDQFQANGLPIPISFRAGGWLLGTNTLAALEQTGFLIESSGRTAWEEFVRKGFPVPWNLSETTRPYKPNREDMNSSAEPTFNIWEFPNNGADSIWFDAPEMIRRFDLNYPNKGTILEQPQVLTYLSHPPFYSIDKPRMEQVFNYISNYLYKDDHGPVVYTTLESAYYSWDRN
jgi:hypothetical protein